MVPLGILPKLFPSEDEIVLPEYRAKGANAILFNDLIRWYQKYRFKQALTLAMMETNDGVLSAWQYLEAKTVKRLRSYKKLL